MTNRAYTRGRYAIAVSGWSSFSGATVPYLATLLVSSMEPFDPAANVVDDLNHELSSASYIANGDSGDGRIKLSNVSALEVDTSGFAKLSASSVDYNLIDNETVGAVVTFVSAGPDDANNTLLFWHDIQQTPNGGMKLRWNEVSGMGAVTSGL